MKWWVPISALESGAFGALSLRQRSLLLQSALEVLICSVTVLELKKNGTVQWQGHGVPVDRIAVFAVIQQRHTKVVLRQVGPFVTPNLTRTPWWKINSITSATSPAGLKHGTEIPDRHFNWFSSVLHLKSGPVPWSVPVRGSLHVTKLDLVCSTGIVDPHWEFHLEELVGFSPLHLKS